MTKNMEVREAIVRQSKYTRSNLGVVIGDLIFCSYHSLLSDVPVRVMLQSVPVISPFNCLVMWRLSILLDTWRLPPHRICYSPHWSSGLHPSVFIILPLPVGLSNNYSSNIMSQREREKGERARNDWRLVNTGFLEPETWTSFFFFP